MPNRLEPEPMPRRDFISIAGIWTASIAVLGSLIGMARLINPALTPEAGKRFRIGSAADFPAGTQQVLAKQKVLIISDARGIAALSLICTHLGCIVTKTETGFSCPCHGSKFGPTGEVLAGPAPSALKWYQVSQAVDGRLMVDAKQEVPAETFFRA